MGALPLYMLIGPRACPPILKGADSDAYQFGRQLGN